MALVSEDVKLGLEIGGFVIAVGGVALTAAKIMVGFAKTSAMVGSAVTKFELIGQQQASEIKELKLAVEKLGGVMEVVAVQKEQIQTIRDTQLQNTKRTDETFTRIFEILKSLGKLV